MNLRTKLTAIAAFVLALAFPAAALEYNDGKITWTYVPVEGSTNEVCLGDGTNACVSASVEGAITLPDTIGGKRVTVVAANAFKGCTKVTGVSILGNLEWIEEGAFDGATSLKTFGTLNRNENFFSYQGSLYAGDWEGAELVRVPPALEAEEFTGLVKPQVWYVYPGAFNECAAIKKIQVNYDSAEAIRECSFAGCTAFTEFVWADDFWDEYLVKDGVLYCGDCELVKWPTAKPLESFESMVLSEYAEFAVADGAFAGNPMESIALPNWASVGAFAFVGCSNLKTVKFLGYPDWQCDVLECAEEAGVNLQKVIYPGFPRGMAEEWEGEIEWFKDAYPESKIAFERGVDPNIGKANITIPYTDRWDLCRKYDFEAYSKDLTTLTFEGPCPDEFWEILDICSNVTKVVYSANPLYRDHDVDWMSWKSIIAEFEGVPGAPEFVEDSVPAEPQWVFEDGSLYACEVGWDDGKAMPIFLPCVWPLPANGELVIPDRIGGSPVWEISWSAFYGAGTEKIRSLTLPRNVEWIDEEAIDALAGWSSLAEIKMSEPMQTPETQPFQWQSTECEPQPFEQHAYAVIDGALCGGDYAILRVPPAYRGKVRLYSQGYPVLRDEGWGVYWNALSNCRYVDTIEIEDLDSLWCLVDEEIDLSGCDSLVAFANASATPSLCEDEGIAIIGGAIYEDWGDNELCLLLWPNAKRPIEFAKGTVEVNCAAFRYVKNPEAITELTVPAGCYPDLWCLAEDYGFTGITKLIFEGDGDISSDIVEVLPGLKEIVYSPSPFYAENWECIRDDFEGTGVKFTAAEPSEPLYGYELDIWDEDDEGNILSGECYLGYNGYPFVYPALKGAYEIPERIENCRVVWAYENAFANMGELTELAFPQTFRGFDAGSYRDGYYDTNTWAWVTTGEVDIVYSPFVGCTSLKKLTFNGTCPEGLWEVLEVTPSIREVYYNDSPWCGESGWIWSEFIAEFKAEHPESPVKFIALPMPKEPIWNVDSEGWLCGEYYPEDGIRVPCVWPDLVGETEVPNGVYGIGENAFACMSNLTALTFPRRFGCFDAGTYRDIDYSPFVGCTSLAKLTFNGACPEGLWEVLEVTPSIREVYYNDSPWYGECGWIWREFIAEFKAAYPEANVTFIALPLPKEPVWSIEDGELYGEYDPETGWRVPCVWPDLVGEATVPDNVYYIGENAFACMSSLTALTIPASVEEIADAVFVGCTSLKKLVFQGGYVPSGVWELLEFTPGIEEVVVPSWACRQNSQWEDWEPNEWLEWFVMDYKAEHPDSTIVFKTDDGTVIDGYIPWTVDGDTMTVDWGACIEENAFVGVDLSGVTKLVLPSYVDYVEDGVFGALKNLREVEVYGFYAAEEEVACFADAFGEGQRVALTIKPIAWWCCDCEGCGNDDACPTCKTDDEWGDCNENCGCPGHLEVEEFAIPGEMFSGCEWIETLAVDAPAFAIGDYAFSECVNLKSVTIPASVEWIGESAFAGCTSLDAVYFNGNAPYGCLWLYEEASSNLVSYVKFGTTGWTGLDGDVGMPADGLWPVWDEDDPGARRVEYGKATVKYLLNGELLSSKEVAVGEPFALIPDPEKTGYTFDGWYDEAGEKVADGAEFTIGDFFGSLTFSGALSANSYSVRFDANGGEGTMADQTFAYDQPQALKANAFERKTFEFLGWAKTADGEVEFNDAAIVGNLLAENGASMTLYAVWKRSEVTPGEIKIVVDEDTGKTKEIIVLPEDEPEFVGDVATVYDGLVKSDAGVIVGTIQVKAAKANKNSGISKLTATMQLVGEKKLSFKGGEWGPDSEYAEMTLKDGRKLTIAIGEYGLVGTFGDYKISGSANIFSSKKSEDEALVSAVMAKCKAFTVVYYEGDAMGTVILTIGSKGKVTAAIQTPSGASAKATAQLLVGDDACCIPVVSTSKKVSLAFIVWIDPETLDCTVDGPDSWDGYEVGMSGGDLEADVVFRVADPDAVSDLLGDDTFVEFLPEESVALVDGKKLVVADGAKPGKIVWDKKEEDIDWDKSKIDGYNVSGLKLSYTAKTGAFKGSFKAFALVKGKVKAFTFKVTGVILNGCGYGTATYKKSAVPVEIDL